MSIKKSHSLKIKLNAPGTSQYKRVLNKFVLEFEEGWITVKDGMRAGLGVGVCWKSSKSKAVQVPEPAISRLQEVSSH